MRGGQRPGVDVPSFRCSSAEGLPFGGNDWRMGKLDLKKELPDYFKVGSSAFSIVALPAFRYFMVDGEGDPNTATAYSDAITLLYAASYSLKFLSKKERAFDYVVPPLEALWWSADMSDFESGRKDQWKWTAMIMVPEQVSGELIDQALANLAIKRPDLQLSLLRVDELNEGRCVQILHLGPYEQEGLTLRRMHREFLPENGFTFAGKHHEIYLSDPRKSAPEKIKTILRQPIKAKEPSSTDR